MTRHTVEEQLDEWAAVQLERAGELFLVDGVAVAESEGSHDSFVHAVEACGKRGLPVALFARTPEGARAAVEKIKDDRPLLIPPKGGGAPYERLAADLKLPFVISADTLEQLIQDAGRITSAGVENVLLAPPDSDHATLHQNLSEIRRGALNRAHPGFGYPVFLRVGPGEFEKAVIGITKFASVIVLDDHGGETWLPLWTLRQNIYTDPQKPLQIDPGVYPLGEPKEDSPLLVTTNFSLTYFVVSTELDGTGVPSHLAVVDAEGMSVLTAWSAGKFGGERVGKELKNMGALELVNHRTVIIPGLVAVISGELEDELGSGWRVVPGPQEASDIGAFFRDFLGR